MQWRNHRTAVVAILILTIISGCLGGVPISDGGTNESVPTEPSTECTGDESMMELELSDELPSQGNGFELTASKQDVEQGKSITFNLTNVASDDRMTGTSNQYAVQRRAKNDWKTVTLLPSNQSGFNATAINHIPETGFNWTFEASAAGFSAGKFVVCERLTPGEYRFVYWSIIPEDDQGSGTDVALGQTFTITE